MSTPGPSARLRDRAVFRGEDGDRREWSFAELSIDVRRLAEALQERGIEPGDRVAIYMPMCPEAAIASHACAHVGAVQVPIFSGFAAPAVAQRLQDSGAKAVITADCSLAAAREFRCGDDRRGAAQLRPSSMSSSGRATTA